MPLFNKQTNKQALDELPTYWSGDRCVNCHLSIPTHMLRKSREFSDGWLCSSCINNDSELKVEREKEKVIKVQGVEGMKGMRGWKHVGKAVPIAATKKLVEAMLNGTYEQQRAALYELLREAPWLTPQNP